MAEKTTYIVIALGAFGLGAAVLIGVVVWIYSAQSAKRRRTR